MRLAAPGLARLTADADGLVVHHCLANRRDLHAEYPPGAAPYPGPTQLHSGACGISRGGHDEKAASAGASSEFGRGDSSGQVEAVHAPVGGSRVHEQDGQAAGGGVSTGSVHGLDTGPGQLWFPWECGPLLEALLHGTPDAGAECATLTVAELPAPAPEGGVAASDVVHALMDAGVLVAA